MGGPLVTSQPAPDRRRLSPALTRVVVLLGISVFINYIDRGNLSIAAPLLKEELGISASQLGILLSSFFWTYASLQILSGWLVDRFDVNWVIALGFFLWSSATAVTGIVHGFAALLAVRLLLGIGESVAFPSYSKILAGHVPEYHRGLANAAIAAGLACGPGAGMFMGGMLMARFGWRSFFVILGLVSLLWLFPWFKWMPRGPGIAASAAGPSPGIPEILRQRSAWGTCAGLFCSNYVNYFLITWLPFYLVRERHFSMGNMAKIGGVAYTSAAVSAIIAGRLSDRWIVAGGTPTRVRKTFTGAGLACSGTFLLVSVISGPALSVALLTAAVVSFGVYASNNWAITQTLAGPQAAGRWAGIQNFVGNLAGVVAPALTGFVVDRTGQFFWAFAILAAVALTGALAWVLMVGPVKQVTWAQPTPVRVAVPDPFSSR
jgi:MFS transporter, ACS family, D-galactonate transporter